MTEPESGFRAELWLNPKSVLVTIALIGLAIALGAELLARDFAAPMLSLVLILYAAAILGWFLTDWRPALGRWFVVLMLAVLILAALASTQTGYAGGRGCVSLASRWTCPPWVSTPRWRA
jgi:hypothetical protein